jgi:hypothetical protein
MSMKNSSDTIGNRTRDLPACSAVPQPTAPPGTPIYLIKKKILNTKALKNRALSLSGILTGTYCNNLFHGY